MNFYLVFGHFTCLINGDGRPVLVVGLFLSPGYPTLS